MGRIVVEYDIDILSDHISRASTAKQPGLKYLPRARLVQVPSGIMLAVSTDPGDQSSVAIVVWCFRKVVPVTLKSNAHRLSTISFFAT